MFMTSASVTEQDVPEPGTYEIDPAASTIRFETRSVFGLLPVRGTFAIDNGKIAVSETAEDSTVDVTVRAAGIDSGNAKRDDHIRSADYLDAAGHPDIAFHSRSVERSATGDTLQGELTVRGVTAPMTVTVDTVSVDGARITARGSATIDRYAFGITAGKGMTGRHTKITVDVTAAR
jgi:polyisoprenoid-binding protein YceI